MLNEEWKKVKKYRFCTTVLLSVTLGEGSSPGKIVSSFMLTIAKIIKCVRPYT